MAVDARAQRRHGPSPLDTLGKEADQNKGWEILQEFRSLGISRAYRFRFQLMVMPRRERTRRVNGLMLGGPGETGPISRVDVALADSDIGENGEMIPADVQRLLLQNGIFTHAFSVRSSAEDPVPALVPSEQYFDPIAESDFTVFDLLMPYQFWQSFYYEGRTKLRGRPAHVFWLYPPKEEMFIQQHVSGVRVFLDEEFKALLLAEVYDAEKAPLKTVSIVDFKKVDGYWILKEVDVRNEKTRDKTRFKVLDAAVGVELPPNVLTVQGLTENVYGTELAFLQAVTIENAPVEEM